MSRRNEQRSQETPAVRCMERSEAAFERHKREQIERLREWAAAHGYEMPPAEVRDARAS